MTAHILLVFLISFAAAATQTVVGFGYVIISMALLPLFLPVGSCLVLAQVAGAFMSLLIIWGHFPDVDWKKVSFPSIFASVSSILGLMFLGSLNNALYMKLLGVILVGLALWMLKFSEHVKLRSTPVTGALCGTIAGLMGSLFGVSVPPLVLYYSSGIRDKNSYVMNLQFTLMVQTTVCIIGRACMGMWVEGSAVLCLPALAGALLGKLPGKWLYNKLDLKTFKLLVYIFMAVIGVYIFLSN